LSTKKTDVLDVDVCLLVA